MQFLVNAATVAVCLAIVLIYRYLDKGNRSLDKVKKFADKSKDDINSFVDNKVADLRNIAIEVDVHQKAAVEVFKRLTEAEGGLKAKAKDMDDLKNRINSYDKALNELVALTGKVDINLKRLEEESVFVDQIGRKLKESSDRLGSVESKIPVLVKEFEAKNIQQMEKTEKAFTSSLVTKLANVDNHTKKVEQHLKEFNEYLVSLEARRDNMAKAAFGEIDKFTKNHIDQLEARAKAAGMEFQKALEAAIRRGSSLEDETFVQLKNLIDKRGSELHAASNEVASGIKALKNESSVSIEETFVQLKNLIDKRGSELQATSNEVAIEIRGLKEESSASVKEAINVVRKEIKGFEVVIDDKIKNAQTDLDYHHNESLKTLAAMTDEKRKEFSALKANIDGDMETFLRVFKQKDEELREKMAAAGEQSRSLADDVFRKLQGEIESQSKAIKEAFAGRAAFLARANEESISKLVSKQEGFNAEVDKWKLGVEDGLEKTTGSVELELDRMNVKVRENAEYIDHLMASSRIEWTGATEKLESLKKEMEDEIGLLNKELFEHKESVLRELDNNAGEIEVKVLESLETRLNEFNDSILYKLKKLEKVNADIDTLDEDLKGLIQNSKTENEEDLRLYKAQFSAWKNEESAKSAEFFSKLDEGIKALDKQLTELKSSSYQNVSSQLKIFEDDFTRDLKNRAVAVNDQLAKWKINYENGIRELEERSMERLDDTQRKVVADVGDKTQKINASVQNIVQKLESQIHTYQAGINEKISIVENSVTLLDKNYVKQLEQFKSQSQTMFDKEFQKQTINFTDQLRKLEKDVEVRTRQINDMAASSREKVMQMLESSNADVAQWQSRVLADMKTGESDVTENIGTFKSDMGRMIEEIRSEFGKQKEDLITRTSDERIALKQEVREVSDQVSNLRMELEQRTKGAFSRFETEYEKFMQDFLGKAREQHDAYDERIKEFKNIANDVKERVEGAQKKLLGRIEENYKVLATTLSEIDKKQKVFLSQTQLFDRADTMKESLTESIEQLKTELAKVEAHRTEMKDLETQCLKTLKVGEEVNIKMSRFASEKRRIEDMEGDFKKLLNISQAVDLKLDQITTSHDKLQDLQIKFKGLDDLQVSVFSAIERLEKKHAVVENTIERIDSNHESINLIEKDIRALVDEVKETHPVVSQIMNDFKEINKNKTKLDVVVKQVKDLEKIVEDTDKKMEKMQKAREWLASAETRLEEISSAAKDQVKILGTVMKNQGNSSAVGKETGMSVRDMVMKLAKQGWSVPEISRSTKLSRGEVELILEMQTKS